MKKSFETPSRTSPRNSRRGCLCKDGKRYSRKCCDGTLRAQGIGRITNIPTIVTQTRGEYVLTENMERVVPE